MGVPFPDTGLWQEFCEVCQELKQKAWLFTVHLLCARQCYVTDYLIFTMALQRGIPSSLLKTEKYVAQKGKVFCQRADSLKSWAEIWNRETWLFTNIPIPPNCLLKIHRLFGSYDQIRITNNYRNEIGKKKILPFGTFRNVRWKDSKGSVFGVKVYDWKTCGPQKRIWKNVWNYSNENRVIPDYVFYRTFSEKQLEINIRDTLLTVDVILSLESTWWQKLVAVLQNPFSPHPAFFFPPFFETGYLVTQLKF